CSARGSRASSQPAREPRALRTGRPVSLKLDVESAGLSLPPPDAPVAPSPLRAWLYLIGLSMQRQARFQLMVWIALALVVFSAILVGLITSQFGWGMNSWRHPNLRRVRTPTYQEWSYLLTAVPGSATEVGLRATVAGAYRAVLDRS